MQGIREKQRLLVEILTTKAFKNGTLRDSTRLLLEETIEFCAKYERSKRPFYHDYQGPIATAKIKPERKTSNASL